LLIEHFSVTLNNKLFNDIVKELTPEDHKIIIDQYINIEIIFHDLIRLTLKKAHEQLFDPKTAQIFKDDIFFRMIFR